MCLHYSAVLYRQRRPDAPILGTSGSLFVRERLFYPICLGDALVLRTADPAVTTGLEPIADKFPYAALIAAGKTLVQFRINTTDNFLNCAALAGFIDGFCPVFEDLYCCVEIFDGCSPGSDANFF